MSRRRHGRFHRVLLAALIPPGLLASSPCPPPPSLSQLQRLRHVSKRASLEFEHRLRRLEHDVHRHPRDGTRRRPHHYSAAADRDVVLQDRALAECHLWLELHLALRYPVVAHSLRCVREWQHLPRWPDRRRHPRYGDTGRVGLVGIQPGEPRTPPCGQLVYPGDLGRRGEGRRCVCRDARAQRQSPVCIVFASTIHSTIK